MGLSLEMAKALFFFTAEPERTWRGTIPLMKKLVFAFCFLAFAQNTPKHAAVNPADTAQLIQGFRDFNAAVAKWDALKKTTADKYVGPIWGKVRYTPDFSGIIASDSLRYPTLKELEIR